MEKSPSLCASRLRLRAIYPGDLEDLIRLLTHERVTATYMVPPLPTRESRVALAERICRLSQDPGRFVYGIFREDTLIGLINETEIQGSAVELGFALHPDCWGQGYATQALTAAMEELFRLGFQSVIAGAFEENPGSIRVMEKCGMEELPQGETVEYRGSIHRCRMFRKGKCL